MYYSKSEQKHIEEDNNRNASEEDKLFISGTDARQLLREYKTPPAWFMRPEISKLIIDSLKNKEEVFVK